MYRTGKYTVCRRIHASLSPEILQAGALKGLGNTEVSDWLVSVCHSTIIQTCAQRKTYWEV